MICPGSFSGLETQIKLGPGPGAWRGHPRCLRPARLGRVPFLHAWLSHHAEACACTLQSGQLEPQTPVVAVLNRKGVSPKGFGGLPGSPGGSGTGLGVCAVGRMLHIPLRADAMRMPGSVPEPQMCGTPQHLALCPPWALLQMSTYCLDKWGACTHTVAAREAREGASVSCGCHDKVSHTRRASNDRNLSPRSSEA